MESLGIRRLSIPSYSIQPEPATTANASPCDQYNLHTTDTLLHIHSNVPHDILQHPIPKNETSITADYKSDVITQSQTGVALADISLLSGFQLLKSHEVETRCDRSSATLVLGIDELLGMIMQHADPAVLKECSLCCRRWRSIVQPSLWKRLWLSTSGIDPSSRFLKNISSLVDKTQFLGIESLDMIHYISEKFQSLHPNTLNHVRHVRLDLALPYSRATSDRDMTHFLSQAYIMGVLLSACSHLRTLDVHVGLAPGGQIHIDQYIPAAVEPETRLLNQYSTDTDILDETDEEAVVTNVSRVLLPAIRTLEVLMKRCQLSSTVNVSWSLDFPFAKPSKIVMTTIMESTHLRATNNDDIPTAIPFLSTSSRQSSMFMVDDPITDEVGSFLDHQPRSSYVLQRHSCLPTCISKFTMKDASITHPGHLIDLLRKLPCCHTFSITHASMTTSVVAVLERRAASVRSLTLRALNTLDEDAFFSGFLSKSINLHHLDIACPSTATLPMVFRVTLQPHILQTGFGCVNLRHLNINSIIQLQADFFQCVARSCHLLHHLECRYNPNLTDSVVQDIAMGCRVLQYFDLSGCSLLTLNTLRVLINTKMPCLKTLVAEDLTGWFDDANSTMGTGTDLLDTAVDLADACQNLSWVRFGRASQLQSKTAVCVWILQQVYQEWSENPGETANGIHCQVNADEHIASRATFGSDQDIMDKIKALAAERSYASYQRKHPMRGLDLNGHHLRRFYRCYPWTLQYIRKATAGGIYQHTKVSVTRTTL
ncbi:hypothetical protein BASA62_001325 [Batrachochytrium salamandrivorans]|nr:hypothetical protein BASA62_001325 [Batrachochytrium salamandrivorans]